jgi:NAD(P)H-binding
MVGGYALRYALDDDSVKTVTAIVRRKLGISHPKLREVLHADFADCSTLSSALSGQDAVVFCLGTYAGAVSDAELRKVTVEYTIEFARVLRGASSTRRQSRSGFFILERKRRGPDGKKSHRFRAIQRRGRERTDRCRVRERLPFPPRLYLSSRATQGTEFHLPPFARHLPCVSRALPQSRGSS